MIKKLVSSENHILNEEDLNQIASMSDGYSGADMKSLCQEASLGPIRSISFDMISNIQADQVIYHYIIIFYSINYICVFL